MVLSNQALTTVATVQGGYDYDNEDVIARLIETVSERMSALAGGRQWFYAPDHVVRVSASGKGRIFLSSPPILTVTSVELLDVAGVVQHTFGATDFGISGDGSTGILLHASGAWPWTGQRLDGFSGFPDDSSLAPLLRVTYAGGWVTPWQVDSANPAALSGVARSLPYDLEDACVREVASRLQGRGRDLTIDTQTSESAVSTFRRPPKSGSGLSQETVDVARRYWMGRI